MQLSLTEAEKLARAGAAALQAGKGDEARGPLERIVAAGLANLQVRFMLALACRMAGDRAAEELAVDAILAEDGRSLRALIMKGDCRLAAGDERAASSYYLTAGRLAAVMPAPAPDLAAELRRAADTANELSERFRHILEERLAAKGLDSSARSARFDESLGILFGEKQIYLQQPTAYYYPGLPHIPFYEPSDFPWAAQVEAAAEEIRQELDGLLREEAPFRPYLQTRKDRPSQDFHGLLDNPDWSTLYLWENGGPVEENVARCPRTFAALRDLPLPHITVRAPSILFSLLKGGARIAPHHGMINTRLICHLPLIVPEGCGFRVGNEVRPWEPGKLLIFDDTIEHEAWNDSGEDRIVLIFDVWRPEIGDHDRRAVTAVFEAIDGA